MEKIGIDEVLKELIETHFAELKQECSNFRLAFHEKEAIVTGQLEFCDPDDTNQIIHRYRISIYISENYPHVLPDIVEFEGKVPRNFHTNPTNELCLGVTSDLWLSLEGNLTLIRFVKKCVVPFFLSLYQKQHTGKVVQGERSHGNKGIHEFFEEYFFYKDPEKLQRILSAILHDLLEPTTACPCGCSRIYETCCKAKVDRLLESCPRNVICADIQLFFYFNGTEKQHWSIL